MITHHTQLLNSLIERNNLKSYLEIGVQDPANNFDKIKCEMKHGVDPEVDGCRISKVGSDEYFSIMQEEIKFDLIFIDGLHHEAQVKRDFENSLRCLNENGFIVLHDCLPTNEAGTKVPRETKVWWGDVYKFAMTLRRYDGIDFKTIDIDEGCCVVWKDASKKGSNKNIRANWNTYQSKGRELLNVVKTL